MEEPVSFDAQDLRAEKEKVLSAVRLPEDLAKATARGQYAARLAGRREGRRLPRGGRHRRGLHDRDLRRGQARDRHPPLGRACRSTCAPASGWASGSPRSRSSSSGRRTCRSTTPPPRSSARTPSSSGCSPTRASPCGSAPRCPARPMEVRDVTMDFGYGRAFTESSPEAYERLILDVLLGDPPLFPRHEEVELSWQILDPIEALLGQAAASPSRTPPARWGPGVGRRDDGAATAASGGCRDRRPARAPRPRRSARSSSRLRDDGGAIALGRVLTLRHRHRRAATPRRPSRPPTTPAAQHPCRIIVVVTGNKRGATGSTPRSGSAATPAPARSSCCASTARSPTTATASSSPLLLPDSPVVAWWPGERARPTPAKDPIGAMAQRRITDAGRGRATRARRCSSRADDYRRGDTDLAWTRVTLWRGLLAAALDQPPYEPVDQATVTGAPDCPSTDLLAAWLAETLRCPVTRARTPRRHRHGQRPAGAPQRRHRPGPPRRHRRDPGQPGQPDRRITLPAARSSPSAWPRSCAGSTPTRSTRTSLTARAGQGRRPPVDDRHARPSPRARRPSLKPRRAADARRTRRSEAAMRRAPPPRAAERGGHRTAPARRRGRAPRAQPERGRGTASVRDRHGATGPRDEGRSQAVHGGEGRGQEATAKTAAAKTATAEGRRQGAAKAGS